MAGFLALSGSDVSPRAQAETQMLAGTPPMGWSTWNHYHRDISDALVRAQADALVASGMRDAGYVYVNIDGGWQGVRDADGVLHPNSNFPDMKALGDYIHSKGLKFGIYSGPGPKSCGGQPTSYGFEAQDAKMFASWGVDFLKYDLCSFRQIMQQQSGGDVTKSDALMKAAYEKMHQALAATGRPILFSMCQYGWGEVWTWGAEVGGSMWRISGDINDTYDRMSLNGFGEAGLSKFAGPGRWNDPDFLEVGNDGMNADEQRTHFSLWAMLASPLIAGNDVTAMTEQTKSILLNKEVIAVDQDPLGKQGERAYADGPLEVWARPLEGGAMAVALFNRTTGATHMTLRLKDVGWQGPATARNLWAHEDVGMLNGETTVVVPGHGVVMMRLSQTAK
ncbi:MAG TPA: glycoside hydrolase family 27 protein [Terracidiphilus sp.]|nr:glycoside hydrolase family 27 protein [Terracidiphilus sp.]